MRIPSHTPTPWRVDEVATSCGRLFRVGDEKMLTASKALGERNIGPLIMYDDYPGAAITEQSQNAAFIVRAVNSHDDLVKALADLVACHDAFKSSYGNMADAYYRLAEYAYPQWQAARAILSKAKGEA